MFSIAAWCNCPLQSTLQTDGKIPCPAAFTTHGVFPLQLDRRPEQLSRGFLRSRGDKACQNWNGSTQLAARDCVCGAVCLSPSGTCLLFSWAIWTAVHKATGTPPPTISGLSLLPYESYFCLLVTTPFPRLGPQEVGQGGEAVSCGNHTASLLCRWPRSTPPLNLETGSKPAFLLLPSPLGLNSWFGWCVCSFFFHT